MSVTSSVHSNALNFMSSIQGGVDPRTGQYTLKIELPELGGNDLQGPEFKPTLTYSPLNVIDTGLGMGWTLQLSQYTPHNQVLSLSTGESLKITDRSVRPMKLEEQRLDTFHVYPEGSDGLRVVHRSGLVEILTEQGTSQAQIYLPVTLFSAQGHRLELRYQRFNSTQPLLHTISDGDGRLLLEIERKPTEHHVNVHLQPPSGSDGEALATYVMNLTAEDRRVREIILPSEDQARWTLQYREVLEHVCLDTITTPTGATERLHYQDGGHRFPNRSSRRPLPRVTRHEIEPHFDQPATDIHYSYPDTHNFLGGGSDKIDWRDDGLDNLYQLREDYTYGSIETLKVGAEEVRSIERRYNRFHLLTDETTVQGDCLQRITTTYGMLEGELFKDQPPTCQLPVEEQRHWQNTSDDRPPRSESTTSLYDNHGNLISKIGPDGVEQRNTWYLSTDEDGHPADLEGFVRHLKEQRVIPSQDYPGQASVLCRRYRYTRLPVLDGAQGGTWHALQSDTLVELGDTEREVQRIRHQYTNAPGAPAVHGRPYLKVQIQEGTQTVTEYHYSTTLSEGSEEPVLQIEQVLIGYDGTMANTLEQRALRHGLVMQQRDSDGVETRFVYDRLQRVLEETIAPGKPTQASRHYQYALTPVSGDSAHQILTDTQGVRTRTWLDGLGRVRKEERDHVDTDMAPRFYKTLEVTHDNQGRPVTETHFDWLEGLRNLALPQHYAYDDWGQRCCVTGPDGVQQHEHSDPVGNAQHCGVIVRRWRQAGAGPAVEVSSRTETWLNSFDKPNQVLRQDADGNTLASRGYIYDGLGRCVSETDERRQVTHFSYDAFDRMLTRVQPDNTRLVREYAAHSAEELPVSLRVEPGNANLPSAQVGAQYFDGLSRLRGATTGWRTERFEYQGGESRARRKLTPGGQALEYEYDLSLTPYPTLSTSIEEQAKFEYHPVSSQVTLASGPQGAHTYTYNLNDQLLEQSLEVAGGPPWKTRYLPSLHNRPQRTVEASGLETRYQYHDNGLPRHVLQGRLELQLDYDVLARPEKLTSTDLDSGISVVTRIEYDDQDREVKRTWQQSNQPERTLEQAWDLDGLLKERHLYQASVTLLKETFGYNALGQLQDHQCAGIELPRDALGRSITRQTFRYDSYENVDLVTSQFANGEPRERAQYHYKYDDPCQLVGIQYTPVRSLPDPTFKYDRNGNMVRDQHGHALRYDSQNRLQSVEQGSRAGHYRYDAHNRLIGTADSQGEDAWLLYQGDRLSLAVRGAVQTQYLHHGDQPIGQQRIGDPSQTVLLHTSASHSVVAQSQHGELHGVRYSAYGERHADAPLASDQGFNGEALDPVTGRYLLGSGYRAYDPQLMRFLSPDSLSPFGGGGLNCYGYCRGNPIAFRDPTGHEAIGFSGRLRRPDEDVTPETREEQSGGWLKWLFVGFAVVATVVAVVTFGKAALAAAAAWKMAVSSATVVSSLATATIAKAAGTAALIATTQAAVAGVSAALTVAATAAQVHNAITGSEASGTAAMWLGIAATVMYFGSTAGFWAAGKLMGGTGPAGGIGTNTIANAADDVATVAGGSQPSVLRQGSDAWNLPRVGLTPRPQLPPTPTTTAFGYPAGPDAPRQFLRRYLRGGHVTHQNTHLP